MIEREKNMHGILHEFLYRIIVNRDAVGEYTSCIIFVESNQLGVVTWVGDCCFAHVELKGEREREMLFEL